ncbi:ABC transporter permease/substrate-binding protein [Corynebacterium sp. HS2168-gen11]|uniref:ABC transporter permease/substrate-binding protein n=1 Tax=Corynebacterium sp. HS2168-gen11 TaxID=2974027 RepID=UPI00216ADFDC|nr:ABC transporter permease/substrate-binding protein [Corynebacterium sp. HS2168-gen11]MCS4535816.1 ABC transporter permease/substrate-binding protein [Corynebacterium sp. HS2168-gen11]
MNFYAHLVAEHLILALGSAAIATVAGILVGIWLSHRPKLAQGVISLVNIAYTIPSIALLGVLITLTGIGNTTAVIALVVYGLMPIVRTTYTSLREINPALIEAAEGMGATPSQVFRTVAFPLALPAIISSARLVVTMTIALTGIASFVGAGGLGVVIYRGITTGNQQLIITGSILVALLAILADAVLAIVQRGLTTTTQRRRRTSKILAVVAIISLIATGASALRTESTKTIELATKPMTEGLILGQLVKRTIESNTGYTVNVTDGVGGGTSNIQKGMQAGDFDLYPEYTGTTWQVVLKREDAYSEDRFDTLNTELDAAFGQTYGPMFGFNNTYALGVSRETAERYNLRTFSDLQKVSSKLSFGAEYDFFEREDGYRALTDFYHMNFAKRVDMDNGLKYQALLDNRIDVITVFTTDGQTSDPNLVVLKDDLEFYPSYRAGLLGTTEFWMTHPEVAEALKKLEDVIDEPTMARLNYEVEINKRTASDVAAEFYTSLGAQ